MASIKERVWKELDKNPLLTAKPLCTILQLNYKDHGKYVANLRTTWKFSPRNEQGSIPSIHAWRGWTFLPRREDDPAIQRKWVQAAMKFLVNQGWIQSKARNKWIYFKETRGRIQLFETGRVNLYVRKPATLARAYQLVCNGISHTGLITDMVELQQMLKTLKLKPYSTGIHFKGAHYVFETKQPLPQLTIDFFQKSNGIIIKVGDRTHPTSVEVIASYPDWAERNERMFEEMMTMLQTLTGTLQGKDLTKPPTRLEYIG